MPRFAANLSMMFNEYAFLDRFAAAAKCGFKGVEFLFPYEFPVDEVASALKGANLTQALFNLPPGNWAEGERGMACLPGREAELMRGVEKAMLYAEALDCKTVHLMAGLTPRDVSEERLEATFAANLKEVAKALAPLRITVVIEPINRRDMPGYFLSWQEQARRIIQRSGALNAKVQMDFYHCQIMEGDLTRRLEGQIGQVGHVQVAGVPDRHEPSEGEVNFPHLFTSLDRVGYTGWVGCEYRPRGRTEDGLGWASPYGIKGASA
ncbi:MAG TPA: 2-oxo-tetronate isomerase [Geminicoccus sp.]|jgi:hydroxypyruvate isomerase|uniref:2-oxo-tetronate isomerase n=1 Tax=Geminicoccus sp. TaxID=2024832 RepID=UPI002E329972|nr:2-oxo-tetronate isomerase [Geminicoccus sp.]HEX2525716.1 2-oxo-tetronate isomerase [Geminicoccus sp.]